MHHEGMETPVLNLFRIRYTIQYLLLRPYAEQIKHTSSPSDGIWVTDVFPLGDSSFFSTQNRFRTQVVHLRFLPCIKLHCCQHEVV